MNRAGTILFIFLFFLLCAGNRLHAQEPLPYAPDQMQDDPIVYTFKDAPSRTTVLAMMCIVLAAI